MRLNDQQLGIPETIYKATKAQVEALAGPIEGQIAQAADTHLLGYYNGLAWVWGSTAGTNTGDVTLAASAAALLDLTGQALSLDAQTATYALMGPTSGSAAAPTFRAIAAADIQSLLDTKANQTGGTATITGGGTISLAGYTLTVPATGIVALLGTANVFTAAQEIYLAGGAAVAEFLKIHTNSNSDGSGTQINFYHDTINSNRIETYRDPTTDSKELALYATGAAPNQNTIYEYFRIGSDRILFPRGNVGVGVIPTFPLHVLGTGLASLGVYNASASTNITSGAGNTIRMGNKSATTANYSLFRFDDANDNAQTRMGVKNGDHSGANQGTFFIEPLNSVATPQTFIILPSGNIGASEPNPLARLHVQGAASAITAILRANATTPGDLLQLQKSDGTVFSGVNAIGGQYGKLATTTKTADYTATVSDRCVTANKDTAITITLPAATGSGQTISITSIGAGACTVDGNASETINGETTQVIYRHESITVHDYGTGTWEVI